MNSTVCIAGCDAVAGTGTPIEKVNINPFTVSEVLRLYLLSTSRDTVQHVRYTFESVRIYYKVWDLLCLPLALFAFKVSTVILMCMALHVHVHPIC